MSLFKEKILSNLDIEKQESGIVSLLLFQSFFLGIFFGAFDTAANSLFLGAFPAESLPLAFTVSGLAGILMTALYSYLQEKIPFSHLALYNIGFIALCTFLMWYGFNFTNAKWHVFLVLVMMGPLNILAMIGFWGTAGRIFSLRQGKRLFGLVDTGQILGVILSSYAIPVILSFSIKTKDILFISSVSAVLALIFQSIVVLKNKSLSVKIKVNVENNPEHSFSKLLKNQFVRLMAIFVAISMVTAFFISFSFLAVLKMKYPDEAGLAQFLGIFTGTVMIFTLLIKTFVYSKFIKTYGLRTCLIISPVLLLILTVVAAATGSLGGYTAAATSFIFFFLLIALSRLISVSLKSSIEAPSFKVLYQTVSSSLRHHVQARVDGTVNEISALASGIILFALGLLSFFKLIHYTHILIVILIFWTYIAYKLYKAYKHNLDKSLSDIKSEEKTHIKKENTGIATSLLKGDEDAQRVLFVMNIQEKLQPILFERLIPYFLNHRLPEIQQYAISRVNAHHVYEAIDTLNFIDEESIKFQSHEITNRLTKELILSQEQEKIAVLSRSKIASERELAARLIGKDANLEMSHHLKFLLRDFDSNVKIAAIKASAQLKSSEMATILSEFLGSKQYGRYAFDALTNIGEPALDCLEHLFNKASNDSILLSRIIRIIGNIGSEKACESLLHKLSFHDIHVARLAAKLLLKNQFSTNISNSYLAEQALMHLFQIISWNIAARVSLMDADAPEYLQNALKDEIKRCFDHLFTLLALMYEAKSIMHIRQNIEGEGSESIDYAIELLEIIVADNLKPMLFPIIDDSSDNEKIKKLQEYFPVDKMPLESLLLDIINRDYNYIDLWTKTCAFNIILSYSEWEITNDIVAQLFNPDELTGQLAALVIYKNAPQSIQKYYKRLPEKLRLSHQKSIEKYKDNPVSEFFEKVLKLKNTVTLKDVSGNVLYDMSRQIRITEVHESEEVDSLDEDLNILVYLVFKGEIQSIDNEDIETFGQGSFFGGVFAPGYPQDFPRYIARKESTLGFFTQEALDKFLFDYPDFAEVIMSEDLIKRID